MAAHNQHMMINPHASLVARRTLKHKTAPLAPLPLHPLCGHGCDDSTYRCSGGGVEGAVRREASHPGDRGDWWLVGWEEIPPGGAPRLTLQCS
jgi:hypothetical protein